MCVPILNETLHGGAEDNTPTDDGDVGDDYSVPPYPSKMNTREDGVFHDFEMEAYM